MITGYAVEGRSEHCPAHVTNEASFPSASPLHSNKTSIGTSGDGSSNNTSTSDSGSSTRSSARSTRSTRSSSSSSGSKEPPHAEALLQRPVVLIANHQSMLDVAAIFALELKVAWVAKTAVFMMPGVGWLMFMAGYVPVRFLLSLKKERRWIPRSLFLLLFFFSKMNVYSVCFFSPVIRISRFITPPPSHPHIFFHFSSHFFPLILCFFHSQGGAQVVNFHQAHVRGLQSLRARRLVSGHFSPGHS